MTFGAAARATWRTAPLCPRGAYRRSARQTNRLTSSVALAATTWNLSTLVKQCSSACAHKHLNALWLVARVTCCVNVSNLVFGFRRRMFTLARFRSSPVESDPASVDWRQQKQESSKTRSRAPTKVRFFCFEMRALFSESHTEAVI